MSESCVCVCVLLADILDSGFTIGCDPIASLSFSVLWTLLLLLATNKRGCVCALGNGAIACSVVVLASSKVEPGACVLLRSWSRSRSWSVVMGAQETDGGVIGANDGVGVDAGDDGAGDGDEVCDDGECDTAAVLLLFGTGENKLGLAEEVEEVLAVDDEWD